MKLFEKLLCKHKWESHAKKEMVKQRINPLNGRMEDYLHYTKEVLICKDCGKIKTLEY